MHELNYSENELKVLAENILNQAKKLGASSAETAIGLGAGFEVRVRQAKIEKIEHHLAKELGITVYFKHRSGCASTTDLSQDSVKLVLEKACYIAKHTQEDPCIGLADPEVMAHGYPDLELSHPWTISLDDATKLAQECEAAGFAEDKRIINSEGADVSSNNGFNLYANSHGFIGSYPSSMHSISCALIAKQKQKMQIDYEYTMARDPTDLESATSIGKKAAGKTIKKLGARHLTTRECPVIFLAPVAKSIIRHFLSAINGGNLYNKASFLLDHLQKQVFAHHVSIEEQPHIKKAAGSSPFDSEGVNTKPRFIVQDGILQGYVLSSYTARKLNMQTTGNAGGIHNLLVTSGDYSLPELIKTMNRGLLITELLGQEVNIITGNYSRGAFGYFVENGEIQYPVEGITIAGNLQQMFMDIISIGNDVDNRGNIRIGSILMEKLKIAGS